MDEVPDFVTLGENTNAFLGGFPRLGGTSFRGIRSDSGQSLRFDRVE